ncbi:MAG: transglycosylase SLT domain-containing protein [Rhodocyclaceae bacterium]|nr:transglycosylase SLT domain-containing protein [Rhodocyclaceae bacterium]
MSHALRLRRVASRFTEYLFHFLHGSLLTTGVLVAIGVAALIGSGVLQDGTAIRRVQQWANAAAPFAVPAPAPQVEEDDAAQQPALNGRMRAVVEYVSKRYRVAAGAIEPIVHAAHEAGARAGLDPLLVIAVIAVESGFNPFKESVMGAQGLMQVIARFHPEKLPAGDPLALIDPVTNVEVGVKVLKESIRRAGSLEAGLQQYAGASDDEEFVYSGKVMAEKQRLEQIAARRSRG